MAPIPITSPKRLVPAQTLTDADVTEAAEAVHQFLRGRLRDPHQIDDVCQEAIARLWQARDRLDSTSATAYAITVAKNIVVGEARRADIARRHNHRLDQGTQPPSPEDLAIQRADGAAVTAALHRLPPDDRHDLVAHVVENQPLSELATRSSGTPGGVAARLARTRARVRVDYLVAARDWTLPSERCHPILVALSAGDRRRQQRLQTAEHLLHCDACAELAPRLIERRRSLLGFLPIPAMATLLGKVRHRVSSSHAAFAVVGVAVAALIGVVSTTLLVSPRPRQQTTPIAAPIKRRAAVAATRPVPGPGSSSRGSGSTTATPPLASNGAELLPLTADALAAHAGQPVTGSSVVVQSPLAPLDGISVGDSPTDSIFVDLADPLPNAPTQPLTPYKPGQKVTFTGKLVANTPQYISEARDADHIPNVEQIIARGYHIEALPADVQPA